MHNWLRRLGHMRYSIRASMSEERVGLLAFPLVEGGFDYLGFRGDDEATMRFCGNLFKRLWADSVPVRKT
jgi:hypothetical protein